MRRAIDFGDRPWHRWFAWYPVRIDNQRVWWEWIERKKDNYQGWIIPHYRFPLSCDAKAQLLSCKEGGTR